MKKRNLQQWCDFCAAITHNINETQDRYLGLYMVDVLKYLESYDKELYDKELRKTISDERVDDMMVGDKITDVCSRISEDLIYGEVTERDIMPVLSVFLMAPLATWISQKNYVPDEDFLSKTRLSGCCDAQDDIPYEDSLSSEELWELEDQWVGIPWT